MPFSNAVQVTRRMIKLFPGVRVPDLVSLVDADVPNGVSRGGIESAVMTLNADLYEDDDGGIHLVEGD